MLPDKRIDLFQAHPFDPLQFPGALTEGFVGIVFVECTSETLGKGLGTQGFASKQKGFGTFELFGRDALLDKRGDHFSDHLDGLDFALEFGLDVPGEVAGRTVEGETAVGGVGQAPFDPDFLHETASETAAAEDKRGDFGQMSLLPIICHIQRSAKIDVCLLRLGKLPLDLRGIRRCEMSDRDDRCLFERCKRLLKIRLRLFPTQIPTEDDGKVAQAHMGAELIHQILRIHPPDTLDRPVDRLSQPGTGEKHT